MPTEQQKKKTGQTLQQTAQNVGDPSNMARILGTAGEGFADFLSKAYEYLVPQSVEELAMEGSPVGKAIGLIPGKYIQPFAKRLLEMIEKEKGWLPEVQQAAWEAVDRNPRIAAHIDEVRPFRDFDITQKKVLGDYQGLNKSRRELYTVDPAYAAEELGQRADKGLGAGLGATIRLDPTRATYGGAFEPVSKVADHEMAHAAQDLWNPSALGPNQRYQTYDYEVNPFEIGANATADPSGGNYWTRIERALNAPDSRAMMGTPERAKMIRDMNRTMAPQNRTIVLDPKSNMLRVVLSK